MRVGSEFKRGKPFAYAVAVLAAGLLLANCSSGTVDPKYGVSSSARVVEPGAPVPKGGGVYRVGKPYVIAGKTYVPEENINYRAEGMASWYGDDFHGRFTANGEVFDMNSISAAHTTLPLPSYVRVTNLKNQRSLIVRVNDRGPYAHNRLIDLSYRSAQLLGFHGHGLAPVRVEYVGRAPLAGSDDRKLVATLRHNGKPVGEEEKTVRVASSKPFSSALFDSRPMTQVQPKPQQMESERDAESASEGAQADSTDGGDAKETVKATAPLMKTGVYAGQAVPPSTAPAPRLTSQVSAYAPVRYDGSAGVVSGRGLY